MSEIIQHQDQYYILATSSLADDRTRVLKQGNSFAIFNRNGDILPLGMHEQGFYHEGTRFLSHYEFRFAQNLRPILLSSSIKKDNLLLAVDLTNPDCKVGNVELFHGTAHILRRFFIWRDICYEKIRIWNLGSKSIRTSFMLRFDADYRDIFEVRGLKRRKRGNRLKDEIKQNQLILAYQGLDEVIRKTRIHFEPKPVRIENREVYFDLNLKPKEKKNFYVSMGCEDGIQKSKVGVYGKALARAEIVHDLGKRNYCRIETSNDSFNQWMNQSLSDLQMMITETEAGLYPYAGVPWFNTPFGRDGIITAFEMLWINPEIAKGVLRYLASTQAQKSSSKDDAEPGKILHETRKGEMVNLAEVPFGKYYGSIDSTPLFLMLAGAYYERTGDEALIRFLWPAIELALKWIDRFGDIDGDGFVEYKKHSRHGLNQQGWKDSDDSIFHANGKMAQGPSALCEVQGYVYAAKRYSSKLALLLGHHQLAENLIKQSLKLKRKFNDQYWIDELSIYGIALDGKKKICRVRTSNAGQCLWTGIVDDAKASLLARTLFREDFFSGWGIRTVSSLEKRYNPMSYHNGSVWPHDNALIAAGLGRYGFKKEVSKLLTALFDASCFVELSRLPELYCGFEKREGEGPTFYPVACSPQSWAAGAVFLTLQACLGMSINALENTVYFRLPLLPSFIDRLSIHDLRVGSNKISLMIEHETHYVAIHVRQRTGNIKVVTIK